MPLTSTRTITDSKTRAASKAPSKYFIQSGVVDWGGEAGGVGGLSGCGTSSDSDSSSGGEVVVKALTALQALQVSELIALTFQ